MHTMHRMVTLEQVHSFVVVAEERHFGRAAERLVLTQPPLSRRIQNLERELGVELFVRTSRSVVLTAAGTAFLPEARRMLQAADHAVTTARRAPSGEVGTVSIGFTAATAYSYLGPVLERARRRQPDVRIELRELVSEAQLDALREGSLDIGLLRPPVHGEELSSRLVADEAMLLAMPSGSRRRRVRASELDGAPLIMYWPTGSRYFHDLVLAGLAAARVHPEFRQYVTQVHTALALVRAGLGWALVPAAARALHLEGVSLADVAGFEHLRAELHAAWRPDRPNPARDVLLRSLRAAGRTVRR